MKKLLTAHEIADNLNLSVETIWRYTREKKIPVVELGNKQYRYEENAVLAALSTNNPVVRDENPGYVYRKRLQGSYTYEDYLKIPEEPGYRHEILEGFLIKEPSPSAYHQSITRELTFSLMSFFNNFDPEGEMFFAPLNVTLSDINVVQPDIFFISGSQTDIIRKERINGPCMLVVEIMSPSNRRKDRLHKMNIYRKAGIPHYWLADPEEKTLEAFQLRDGNYVLISAGGPDDKFTHPEFPDLKLDLNTIFYWPY